MMTHSRRDDPNHPEVPDDDIDAGIPAPPIAVPVGAAVVPITINRCYAYICGVSDYMIDLPNGYGGELPENFEGANRLEHCLIDYLGVLKNHITRVDRGGRASASNAIGILVELSMNWNLGEHDLCIISFSTRGSQTGGLQFSNIDQRHGGFSTISFEELSEYLERIPSNILLILECCYAGKVRHSPGMQALVNSGRIAVLYSCAEEQETEATGVRGRLFVDTLIQALKGNTDIVDQVQKNTLEGRMKWVATHVDEISQTFQRRQTPSFWCESPGLNSFDMTNFNPPHNSSNQLIDKLKELYGRRIIDKREQSLCEQALAPLARDPSPITLRFIRWLNNKMTVPQEIEQSLDNPPMAFRRYSFETLLKRNRWIVIIAGVMIVLIISCLLFLIFTLYSTQQSRIDGLMKENVQLKQSNKPINSYFLELSKGDKYYEDLIYCADEGKIFKGINIGQTPARTFTDLELPRIQAFIMFANAYSYLDEKKQIGVNVRALRPSKTRNYLKPSYIAKGASSEDNQYISILLDPYIITEKDLNISKANNCKPSGKDVGRWLSDKPTQEEVTRWLYRLTNTSEKKITQDQIIGELFAQGIISKEEVKSTPITRGEFVHWLHNAMCYMKFETPVTQD